MRLPSVMRSQDRGGVRITRSLLGVTLAVIVLLGGGTAIAAPPSELTGTSPGMEVTARWWQVAITNFDTFFSDSQTGENCITVDLPSGPVVLVAGTLGGASGPRACTVPAGAKLVLPVINWVWALTDPAPLDTVGEARLANRDSVASVTTATATIDGNNASVTRVVSSRFLVDGSLFGFDTPLVVVSDGYWLLFRLSEGVHTVSIAGATSAGFSTSAAYTFTVT